MRRHILSFSAAVAASLLSACGGGGGSDGPLASPYTPSVDVVGLDAAESVEFNLNGTNITATTNTRFTASSQVLGNYSAFVVTQPAGKTCRFNGGTTIYNGSATLLTLTCTVGTTTGGGGGGGGGTAGPALDIGTSPFQSYAWWMWTEPSEARISSLVSLTNLENVGLTNATASNFVYSLDNVEFVPSTEHRVHVEPLTVGLMPTAGAVAVDVSASISDAQVATMKQQLDTFFATTTATQQYRLSWFDDRIQLVQDYTNVAADLQTAVAAIPDTLVDRNGSTDLYGAVRDASTSFPRPGSAFDYVVVVSDGDHSASSTEIETALLDDTEFNLIFAIAVGPNPNITNLEKLVAVRNEENASPSRVLRITDMSQLSATLQTISSYVSNMIAGMHAIHYITPRRDDKEIKFTYSPSSLSDCGTSDSLLGCSWYLDFNPATPTPYDSPSTMIYAFANSLQPLEGDTVRVRLPNWPADTCSSSTGYSWNLTVNFGGATLSAPRNNEREIDVIFDAGVASDVTLDITNASLPLCSGSLNLTSVLAP